MEAPRAIDCTLEAEHRIVKEEHGQIAGVVEVVPHASVAALDNHLVQLVGVHRGCLVEIADTMWEERRQIVLEVRTRVVEELVAEHQRESVQVARQQSKYLIPADIHRLLAVAFALQQQWAFWPSSLPLLLLLLPVLS